MFVLLPLPLQSPSAIGHASASEPASRSPSAAWTPCQGQAAAPFPGPRILGRASEPGLPARPSTGGGDERSRTSQRTDPGRPTHWKGQPHPQGPGGPRGGRPGVPGEGPAPTTLCYGRSGKQGGGPAGAQGAAMGGRAQGERRDARVELPRALRPRGWSRGRAGPRRPRPLARTGIVLAAGDVCGEDVLARPGEQLSSRDPWIQTSSTTAMKTDSCPPEILTRP
ncbi:translation initiation factor IF-2-like [Moschus berezovskii]|uniref:translation initiation factor IF-2-like n=1 Tax=Moschus berezovskii TaxID=68408 RepID=UPI002444721B|nr:translation initiation factor IF-2-like [Moschus berezovskii]